MKSALSTQNMTAVTDSEANTTYLHSKIKNMLSDISILNRIIEVKDNTLEEYDKLL